MFCFTDQNIKQKKLSYDEHVSFIPPPISKKRMLEAKEEYELHKRIKTNLQDISLYLLFTFLLLFVVHSNKSIEKCFHQTEVVKQLIGLDKFKQVKYPYFSLVLVRSI